MPIGIRYNGEWTDRTGMRRVNTTEPIPGALRDWVFDTQEDGPLTSVPDLIGGAPLSINGAQIIDDAGTKWLRFDGVDDYAGDNTLGTLGQPFTLVLVARLQGVPANNKFLVGADVNGTSTIGTHPSASKFITYSGSLTIGADLDTSRHVFISAVGDGSDVFRMGATEYTTEGGALGLHSPRLAANYNLSVFNRMDVQRFAILSHKADIDERAAIVAQLDA